MKVASDRKSSPVETADYISGLAKELRELAAEADLPFLAYLLAMVEDDAQATIRRLSNEAARRPD